MSAGQITAKDSVIRWKEQLDGLFASLAADAKVSGWSATYAPKDSNEDPFGLGASVSHEVPVLVLRRLRGNSDIEERVTFEPVHRFTVGAAGRIDIYAHPTLREAMLLRTPNLADSEKLTWEEAERLVADAPWKLYSADRIPLRIDLSDGENLRSFLEDLTN